MNITEVILSRSGTQVAPRTLDDLLEVVPGLRKWRSLDSDTLRRLLGREARRCTWCDATVPPRRHQWCSDGCVDAFKLRCDPNRYVPFIISRDRGICQLCQRDTFTSEQEGAKVPRTLPPRELALALSAIGFARGRWREVDHLIPVVLGGGLCPPENLRLVCGTCHKAECDRLAKGRK